MNYKLSNRKWMVATLLLFVALVVYITVYPPKSTAAETLAVVNGVKIDKEQLYKTVLASSGAQTVNSMIEKELIRQEAVKAGVQVQPADLDKELATLKLNFPSEAEFNQALAANGLTLDSLKEEMMPQVMMQKILEPQVTVSDDEIKQYYDANLETLKIAEQVKASHILVATKEEADAILADLKNGADFAKIAQEKSQDEGSKENGGDLGFFGRGTMEAPFETAAFSLKVGSLSDVVSTDSGFHIIKVTDHKDASTPTLEDKKTEIHDKLVSQKVSEMSSTWLNQKKSEATIENYLSKGAAS
ncbi:peptidylprolyl isomerase [Paenibacillus radicis (ex Xue et al. 2023)]|uniref:peptidylprolyl isomerase n=1 Tax=Paenibacillus radicis (ex Xue et al. 2023) TaxID=2972489 RepID=A0ABT1YCG8_9BACL|nr:peptidylprolyl isomerase [Paenibacillus radicis (ex Xue et al. 2023)]MCR8630894.1 peptidylprolyl isomerase [Paenibacillus radicis (ex Xue et al. 2023)]